MVHRKYPGRDFVTDPSSANELRFRQQVVVNQGVRDPCERPFVQTGKVLPSAIKSIATRWDESPAPRELGTVEIGVRCRKCAPCLRHRRRLWTARCVDEIVPSTRNWFATLTVKPEQRFLASCEAAIRAKRAGHGEWSCLSHDDQFPWLCKVLGEEITLWLKRVRKASGARFRYLLIAEPHKDGFPHFHALIHERSGTVTKRHLENCWRFGYSQFRLVDSDIRTARYVSKYLAKDARARVRASVRYGRANLVRATTERIEAATRLVQSGKASLSQGAPGEVIVDTGTG